MKSDNFAIFILTHGRPDHVSTYKSLKRHGYTGKVYIIIDNEDETAPRYRELFGDKVIVFDKKAVAATFDTADNFDDRRSVVFARNASFSIAQELGLDYFMQLDDDYPYFSFTFDRNMRYIVNNGLLYVNKFDEMLDILLEYYKSTNLLTLSIGQRGDFIGGYKSSRASVVNTSRKAMNVFLCSTSRPFHFVGRVNEDVNTYTSLGNRGGLFLTTFQVTIQQEDTQTKPGGMSELYKSEGTYIKSFYTVMYCPSAVKVGVLVNQDTRIHHRINWLNAVPRILSEDCRKVTHGRPES